MDRAKNGLRTPILRNAKSDPSSDQEKMQKLDTNGFKHKRAWSLVTGSARFLQMQTLALKLSWPYIYGHNRIPVKDPKNTSGALTLNKIHGSGRLFCKI